jgi:hypothetical protein
MTMQPHEAALHAAQAAQSAAIETRDAVLELLEAERHRQTPARWQPLRFTQANPVQEWSDSVDAPTRSFGIYNPTALPIYVGLGFGSARSNAGAMSVPATSLVILPLAIGTVEVGIDPADAGALAAGDAVVYGLRFSAVQPACIGDVS